MRRITRFPCNERRALTLGILLLVTLTPSLLSGARKWIMADYGNLTFISDAGEKKTQSVFEEIQSFKAGLRVTFDGGFKEMTWPLKIFVCKGKKTMYSLGPERERGQADMAGYYQRGQGYDLIVLNASTNWSELRRVVFHEYAHRVFEGLGQIPLWLDEGYASVFEQFSVKKGKVKFGLGSQYHVNVLAYVDLMPLERLFAADHGSDEYNREGLVPSFYATSWAFVHMCLFARDEKYRSQFFQFTNALKTTPVSEELFTAHFGVSYDQMEKEIRSYARNGKYLYRIVDASEESNIPRLDFRETSVFELSLHQASVLIHSKRFDEARTSLIRCQYEIPTLNDQSDDATRKQHAQLASEFALLEMVDGNHEQGISYAETAVKLGSVNPSTLLIHAESIMGVTPGSNPSGLMDAEELVAVLDILMQVLGHGMNNRRAHVDHSIAWRRTEIYPRESHINALLFACELYPTDKTIHFNVAELFDRIGREDDALVVLTQFANSTKDPSSHKEAVEMMSRIESKASEGSS